MAVNLTELEPPFTDKVTQLLQACRDAGYKMVPTEGIRHPVEQGKLWRQSRSGAVVQQTIADLRAEGLDFIADCIVNAGPANGEHVTNALPGFSWHQWGEAIDCVWVMQNGQENWSVDHLENGKNGYHVYADLAEQFELTAGGHWQSLKDWPHVQLSTAGSPQSVHSRQEINDTMKERFGAD